ncbi:UNVERIFIED_CONTAM: UDP-glycosyltransferase 86A2 [Sesamum radiatum]|uniref:UDP-glycosyltransferase 86A2 n=1 Tax=Sesamum radiatum TaxID=300843 RepID=A0AAW2UA81_SESRA
MAHAIVIPYPYQGHVTPMINLSIRLASRGFTVTFVQTEFIHHFMSKARNLPADDFDLFAEARKSGLDIRYTTFSDGLPLEFDRHLNYEEYWETMCRDFPDRVDEIVVRTMKADEGMRPFLLVADTISPWPATIAQKTQHGECLLVDSTCYCVLAELSLGASQTKWPCPL